MTHYEKMTESKIELLIVRMAIPTIISMLVTNIYNMADTAFVGKLGTSASGAVGIVFGFMTILQAIGFLFGQGAGSIIARKLGAKDTDAASKTASTGLFFAVIFCTIVSAFCFIGLDQLVILLGSTKTIAPYAKSYISYIIFASPFVVASFCMNNILRFEGKAFLGMIGLTTGAVLNIIGDPILMFGLNMGIAGAGLSTCISQIISFGILLTMFLRGKTQCKLSPKNLCFDIRFFIDIVATGLPSLLRQGLNSLVVIVLNMEAAVYGDEAIAAMSIVSRIVFFVFSIALGIGQGFQPVSGFNFGAHKYQRVRKAYRFSLLFGECAIVLLSAIVFIQSGDVIRIFRDDTSVINIGTRALRLQLISLIFQPYCVVTEMILQSTGKKLQASILSSLKSGIIFIPILIVLANLRGLSGIQEAQPLANIVVLIPTIYYATTFFKQMPKEDQ